MAKCRNCGAEVLGLTCPLCGHKQYKPVQCSVCFTSILVGQKNCPNCGNPIPYRGQEDIKKITPDTLKHTTASHNYHTVSENYDYKKNAYNYKKDAYDYYQDYKKKNISLKDVFAPLKNLSKNAKYHQNTVTKSKRKKVFSIIIILLVMAVFGLNIAIITFDEYFSSSQKEAVSLTEIGLPTSMNTGEYNYNFNHDGLVYVYQEQLYLAGDLGITIYQDDKSRIILEDEFCQDIYVNEQGVYYLSDDNYYLYQNGESQIILTEVDSCYYLNQQLIYLDLDHNLRLYDLTNQQITLLAKDVNNYEVNDADQKILFYDLDLKLSLIDLTGQKIIDIDDYFGSYGSYFSDNKYYYDNYDSLSYWTYTTDRQTDKKEVVKDFEAISFYLTSFKGDSLVYNIDDYDDRILAIYDVNDDEEIEIMDDVEAFYVVGNKILFYCYNDDYDRTYYLANEQGDYAILDQEE